MMSEEKCYLANMPWYTFSDILPWGPDDTHIIEKHAKCDNKLVTCHICECIVCISHCHHKQQCDNCTTLKNKWMSSAFKERYEKIYLTKTKTCKS